MEGRTTNRRGMRHPGMPVAMSKEKVTKGTWSKLLKYCKNYWAFIIIAIICACGGTVLTLIGPDKISEITDTITKGIMPNAKMDMDKIKSTAMILAVLYGVGAILSATQGFIMSTVTQCVSRKLRNDISVKINKLPMNYYHHNSTGDVLSRVTNDVDMIATSLNMSIGTMVSAVTLFAGSLIMMIKTDVVMTIAGVLSTLLGFVLMMVIMKHSQKYFTKQQMNLGAINGHIEEIYSGHTVVKAYNGEDKANKQFDELNEALRNSGFKAQAMSGLMMPLMTFIGNFGYVTVCVVGAALAMNGNISFGVIVSFMMYIRYFTQPLSQLAQAFQQLQSAGAASSRVFEFLGEEEMQDESNKKAIITNTKGDVEFSHVRFGYEPDKIIINDFSAKAKAGQKIAIVGPTGCGKTTIINLLMRFYDVNSGKISVEEKDIRDVTRKSLRNSYGMVLQETWLRNATVAENIAMAKPDASREEIISAAKSSHAHSFIKRLSEGYDTVIGEDGGNLSQGQKQLLCITRVMLALPPMLILDEATSSIDTRTEIRIQRAFNKMMKGRTTFIVAHRLSTIKEADCILVMNAGKIIEQGNHEELLAKKGFYYKLWNS